MKEDMIMELVDFNLNAKENLAALYPNGAFLTAGHLTKANTLTIGWGNIGISWSKKVFIAMVTKSRYTHHLIDEYREFTITFPYENMKKELLLVGTKSGRDYNKYDLANLSLAKGQAIETPHIDCKGMTYECRVIYHSDVMPENLDQEIYDKRYAQDQDYHTIYFGEIMASYLTEKGD